MPRPILLTLACIAAMQGCSPTDPTDPTDVDTPSVDSGESGGSISITLVGLPEGDTLRQTGLAFEFTAGGSTPYTSVVVAVDPGTPEERAFVTDGAWLEDATEPFPVVLVGPLPNGSHLFELRIEDAQGRKDTVQFTRVTHVPDVPYAMEFLGEGFDDTGAAGITASGFIAGTATTGTPPSHTQRVIAWSGGSVVEPKSQPHFTQSSAIALNTHGEIVGNATVDGDPVGFLWRGDSLEIVDADAEPSIFALGIDDAHRALVVAKGFAKHLVDLNSGTSTVIDLPGYGVRMNGVGQAVAVDQFLYGSSVATYGGLTITYPPQRPGRRDRLYRGVRYDVHGLNDRSEVLGTRHDDPFLSRPAGTVEYIDHRLPWAKYSSLARAAVLSPSGDVVTLRGDDSLYIWSPEQGTRRLTFANTGWSLDKLAGMNADGHLVAHGANSQTGEKGVLLLSPVAASANHH